MIMSSSAIAQTEDFEPTMLIDTPTAGTLPRGSFNLDFRIFHNGGLLTGLSVGVFDRFMFGISYGGENIIGEGEVNWNPRAEVNARYRLYEESYSLPAISIGFNSQGYGAYMDKDSISTGRYTIKSKGFYVVGSKNYSFLGLLGFHGGINLSLEDNDGDNDPNLFVGFDKSISSEISFVGEYDFAINDNEDNSLVAKKGYLNSALKWNIGSNLNLEINVKNLLNNRKNVPDSNREIKIIYREFF